MGTSSDTWSAGDVLVDRTQVHRVYGIGEAVLAQGARMVDAQLNGWQLGSVSSLPAGPAMEAYSFLVWNHCILPFRFSPSLL